MCFSAGEFGGGMVALLHPKIFTDGLQQECDYINKMVSGANGFELPATTALEFPTLEISSGSAIPYYQSIKRSKLPAATSEPHLDRASELLLVVAIKALGGVFLQGLTGRL